MKRHGARPWKRIHGPARIRPGPPATPFLELKPMQAMRLLLTAWFFAMPLLGCATSSTGKASLLYVGLGKSGRLVPREEGKGTYALTISEPGEHMIGSRTPLPASLIIATTGERL